MVSNLILYNMDKDCCNEENFIYTDIGFNTCVKCGLIKQDLQVEIPEFKKNISFINKTFIPYTSKFRHLHRIHKWQNYDYYEMRNYRLNELIHTYPISDKLKRMTSVIFFKNYKTIRTRGNIKLGLICYSIYLAHLELKIKVDLDYWLKFLNIKAKHYNNAMKKIEDGLIYPENINKYLEKVDNKIDKNCLIKKYNDFIKNTTTKFNSKTILSSLIYIELEKLDLLSKYNVLKIYKISKNSISSIKKLIN